MDEEEQMQVELKLYCDQSELVDDPEADLRWELFVNGQPFPGTVRNVLTTTQAIKIARMLIDIEAV